MQLKLALAVTVVAVCLSAPVSAEEKMIGNWLVKSDRDRFSGEATVVALSMQHGDEMLALRCLSNGLSFAIHSNVIDGKQGDIYRVKFKGGDHAAEDTIGEALKDSLLEVAVTPEMRPSLVTSNEFAFRIIDSAGTYRVSAVSTHETDRVG